ncbi:hypothetical protein C8R45DRAFT_959189 [Mycena sanguinolenta]|nr:hypothetical protein C8R45DRAFT_959189 [Mycena sanguinolenta]
MSSTFTPAFLVALLLLIVPFLPSSASTSSPFATACRRGRLVCSKLGRCRNRTSPLIIVIPPLTVARVLLRSLVNTPRIGLTSYGGICPVLLAKHIRKSTIIFRFAIVVLLVLVLVDFRNFLEPLLLFSIILVLSHPLQRRSTGSQRTAEGKEEKQQQEGRAFWRS